MALRLWLLLRCSVTWQALIPWCVYQKLRYDKYQESSVQVEKYKFVYISQPITDIIGIFIRLNHCRESTFFLLLSKVDVLEVEERSIDCIVKRGKGKFLYTMLINDDALLFSKKIHRIRRALRAVVSKLFSKQWGFKRIKPSPSSHLSPTHALISH